MDTVADLPQHVALTREPLVFVAGRNLVWKAFIICLRHLTNRRQVCVFLGSCFSEVKVEGVVGFCVPVVVG